MNDSLFVIIRRLEFAQGRQNQAIALAHAAADPASGATSLEIKGGWANFFGPGHFLNQGVALGLEEPLEEADLDRIEALLGQGGHSVLLEVTPAAEGDLLATLALRGYKVNTFQQVWMREMTSWNGEEVRHAFIHVQTRIVDPSEIGLWGQVVCAGFQERDELDPAEADACGLLGRGEGNLPFLATVNGEPAGAGILGLFDGVAVLSGTSVLPAMRGQGVQRALILARLKEAAHRGACIACSAALPFSGSQANLERCGFRVAYPKLEMIKG